MKLPSKNLKDFQNRNIWIIGASSGIGEACAELLSKLGANLIISSRRIASLEKVALSCQELHKHKATPLIIPMDVTDDQSVITACNLAFEKCSKIDLLLVMSGIYEPMRADEFDFSNAFKTVNTNLLGVMRIIGQTMPHMIAQGEGHIAITASVAGYRGLPNALSYGPTKAALINFAETLYYDLEPRGVHVHLIAPGFVETPATSINQFKMPALISPQTAALEIIKGLQRGEFDIHFPKKFTYFMKFLSIIPYSIYFWILKKFIKI
jgi:short-subunit dehydrogenase